MSPRTQKQLEDLKLKKKGLILDAALKLFAKESFQSVSISMIAKEAGISKGLMYAYFSSKDELLQEIVMGTIKDMFQISLQCLSKEKPNDVEFKAMLEKYFDWVVYNCKFLKIYFGILLQPNVISKFEGEVFACAQSVFERYCTYFKSKGVDKPEVETRYFVSVLDGVYLNYLVDENYPLQEVKQKILKQYKL